MYQGENITTKEEVAIKLEYCGSKMKYLFYEKDIYAKLKGKHGFPTILWDGLEGEYNCLVMELLGPSLEDLF